MYKKILIFISFFLSLLLTAHSQFSITGLIRDNQGNAISAAPVSLTDSSQGLSLKTITTKEGFFIFENLKASNNYSILISSIGFETFNKQGIILNQNNSKVSLSVKLAEILSVQEEVVVVAYGTQKQKEVTGSVAKITTNDIATSPVTSIDQFIAGKAPGVQISQNSGAPGSNANFRIRGVGSITANTQPLIVIDGFPQIYGSNLNAINLGDIESIEILKDAYATAIYGSRGSNGVVLLTTGKKTEQGTIKVNFNNLGGVQAVTKQIELTDAYQRATFLKTAADNYWVSLNPSVNKPSDPNSIRPNAARVPDFALPYINNESGLTNTNWQDVIYRNAFLENYHLSVSGATDKANFYISGTYLNQQGIVKESSFKRYGVRMNYDARINPKAKIAFHIAPLLSKFDRISQGSHRNDGIIFSALLAHPHLSPYNSDGSIATNLVQPAINSGIAPVENPLALAKFNKNDAEIARVQGGFSFEYLIQKNLTFKTFFAGDFYTTRTNTFHPSFLGSYNLVAPTVSTGTASTQRIFNSLLENTLEFKKSKNNHNINALAGFTFQKENAESNTVSAINFPNNIVTTINNGTVNAGSSQVEEWALASFLTRLNYNYKLKYLIGFSIRADGSSRFGPQNRWGYFPSASAAWRIKEEQFLKNFKPLTDLKIKFSVGNTGNFFIPNYGFQSLLTNANYILNNTITNGLTPSTSPNENLSWEVTNMSNIGIEAAFFKNKLKLNIEHYNSKTKALLLNVPVPAQSGYTNSLQNIGRVQNMGFEIVLSHKFNIRKVEINHSVNFSTNKNTLLELGPGQAELVASGGTNISRVGNPIGTFYGYEIIGVYKNQKDLIDFPKLSTSRVGDYIYKDNNNDGIISDKDRVILGKSQPDILWGYSSSIAYKNFEFSFLIQGISGFQIYNQLKAFTINAQGWSNASLALYKGYFQSEANPGNGFAAPNVRPNDKLYENSNYMVEDGDFIRLRNISLSYSLPKSFTKKKFKATVFIAAKNLFTITNYSGYNPEVSNNGADPITPGIDYGVYPVEKNISFGTKISF